jgi:hypothetical protein
MPSILLSWHIMGFLARVTRQVSLVEQDFLTLPEFIPGFQQDAFCFFEDTKRVVRSCKLKDRQYNVQKKNEQKDKQWSTTHYTDK